LFIYQTLDSTDGKQARRTNSSSPLGELFDHGCDSFTQVFLALQVSMAMSLGNTKWGVMAFWLVAVYMFYAAHWQTYSTGVLKFGKFDIIESQCVIIGILLTTGIFGTEVWFAEKFGISLRQVVLLPCCLIALYVSSVVLYTIYTQAAGKNGTTVANTSVTACAIPILSTLLPPAMIFWKSSSGVYNQHIALFCIAFGMVSVKMTCKIILAHMSHSPMSLIDTILIGPVLVVINQYFGNFVSEYYILWACLIYCFANLYYYCNRICYQICDDFKIHCFRIPYPSSKPNAPSTNGMTNGVEKKDNLHH